MKGQVSLLLLLSTALYYSVLAEHDGDVDDPYHEISNLASGNERDIMKNADLKAILTILRERLPSLNKCFTVDSVSHIGSFSGDVDVNEATFFRISKSLLQFVVKGECPEENGTTFGEWNLVSDRQIRNIISKLQDIGYQAEHELPCFNAFTLQRKSVGVQNIVTRIILYLYEGRCILPTPEYFKTKYVSYLDPNKDGFVERKDIERLMEGIEIERTDQRAAVTDLFDRCYTSEELSDVFEIKDSISTNQAIQMCPTFVQQFQTCDTYQARNVKLTEDVTGNSSDTEYTDAMVYGYGTASVAIISLLALLGMFLFPVLKTKSYKMAMQFLIGLGVGTMAADALLHIIPYILGLHAHEDEHEETEHTEEESSDYVWKMSVVCGGIYAFYFLENCLKLWKRRRNNNAPAPGNENSEKNSPSQIKDSSFHATTSFSAESVTIEGETSTKGDNADFAASEEMLAAENIVCFNFTTTCITVFVGDMLHNFADGLAIGVSFRNSWTSGVGTSLAILCHELPHEFGDFAIYLKNGATKWQAVFLNLFAACCAFIGLYIGIAIADDENIRPWIMAAIGGMFLYISLVQVMHEMISETTTQPELQFILQNLGLLLGWAILLLLSLYEEDIENSVTGHEE